MTTVKLAVSLPSDVAAEARAAVQDGAAPSVSALVADALREQARRRRAAAVLDHARHRRRVAGLEDPAALIRAVRDD